MTAKERVIASRLIEKMESHRKYTERIGITYKLTKANSYSESRESTQQKNGRKESRV